MDYTKVIELYHRNIGRGDYYDEEGRGLKLLSNGMSTTSEALQNELLLFMLSLLVGFDSVSSVQTVLLDIAREDMDFLTTSSDRIMEMASSINAPTGSESACLGAFLLEDATRSYRTGVNTTEATDTLVELFNTMGRAILDNGDSYNIIGENRFDRFMIALENAAANQRAGYDDMVKEAEEAEKKAKKKTETASTAGRKTAASSADKKKKLSKTASTGSGKKAGEKKKTTDRIIEISPDAGQYRGIHEVKEETEVVTPLGTWAIPIPHGCSYTMDPEYAGKGIFGSYTLQIQSTHDCNFSNAYDSDFSFALFPFGVGIDAFSAMTDLSTDEASETIMEWIAKSDDGYSYFLRTKHLAILTKKVPNEAKSYGIMFLIATQGAQFIAHGQVVVHGKTQGDAKKEIDTVLSSISAIGPNLGDDGYKPVVLPKRYGLTYHNHNTLTLDDNIILPVPDGFKGSTDPKMIGAPRRFSIVPSNYNDFSKAMDAIIGITCVPMGGNIPEYDQEICDKVCSLITGDFERQEIFESQICKIIAQKTTKGIIFYQKTYGLDAKSSMAKAVMWVNTSAYIMSFAMNFDNQIADRTDVSNDIQQIMSDWMNRIILPGEKLFYTGTETGAGTETDKISNILSPATPELLHEHYDLITSGGYTTRRDADFIGQPIRGLMEKNGNEDEDAYEEMKIPDDTYALDQKALKLASVFRMDASMFDSHSDREALIRLGAFEDVRMLHALRSLAWMAACFSEQEGRPVAEITYDELQQMGALIEKKKDLNYDGKTGFINLCNHYDWHVFYVPLAYRDSITAINTDLRELTGKQDRGGNTTSVFITGMGLDSLRSMNRNNEIISRNEETLESLEGFRKDLSDLLPIMQTIYNGLMENRDRTQKLEGPLPDALTAWCALAIAAREPFYSEEAADTPEADAALKGPLERPTDKLDDKPIASTGCSTKNTTKATLKPVATEKKPTTKKPAESKAATGKTPANQYAASEATEIKQASKPAEPKKSRTASVTLEKGKGGVINSLHVTPFEGAVEMIVPEGVTRIRDMAFQNSKVEKVVLPKSLKTIDDHAFWDCKKLKEIELPDGLETIEDNAFIGCTALHHINLPDSVKELGSRAFAEPGTNQNLTVHMSSRMANRLLISKKSQFDCPLYCGRYEIDGFSFKTLEEYKAFREKEQETDVEIAKAEGRGVPAAEPDEADYFSHTNAGAGDIAENGIRFDMLRDKGPEIDEHKFWGKLWDTVYLQIPEGVTKIRSGAFAANSKLEIIKLPRSLRVIGQGAFRDCENLRKVVFQDGLEQIDAAIFEDCLKMSTVYLPDSLKTIEPEAFAESLYIDDSYITVNLSGTTAKRLHQSKNSYDDEAIIAKGFIIDGNSYKRISEYIARPAPAPQKPASPSASSPVTVRDNEEEKQRKKIMDEITRLEVEKAGIKGLFSGSKKKKIEKRLDELRSLLRK